MPKLVIVESPAKAKTINRYLGKNYIVRASMGHVRDLPKSKLGVDIENDFLPTYRALAGRKKVLDELKKLAKGADEVFLATDLDREGEAIAWHLAEALKLPAKKVRRVIFNEITKNAIRHAFEDPRKIDDDKVDAQQARRILDRIVGYELSPLLWRKVGPGLSAGRVQSVALRLIVDREREIEAFTAEEYWEIHADLAPAGADKAQQFRAKLSKVGGEAAKLTNEAEAQKLTEALRQEEFITTQVESKERLLPPAPPFITSTLQQRASVFLRFSAKKTMMIAQQLYEGVELGGEGAEGLITYMRTDSVQISGQALNECRGYIGENFAPTYLPDKPNMYRAGKAAQEAHEAIRPSSVAHTPATVKPFLTKDQYRLYELIWKRFVASQMSPARLAVIDVQVTAGDALFTVQGRALTFDGHTKLSGYDNKNDLQLPPLEANQELVLIALDPSQHFTKPPPRFTEAALVKTLEKLGIGRPSTYAAIISTIQGREYVKLEERKFHATELGKLVTDQLVAHFQDIMNVEFTSKMEGELDDIESAKRGWVSVLKDFYTPFAADLEKAKVDMKRPEPEETEFKCTECGKPMLKRWGKRGNFLGCSGYPECRFTQPLDKEGQPVKRPPPETLEEKCPECGEALLKRHGRHGEFIGCSGYPKCKFVRSLAKPIPLPEELKKCEKCGSDMTVRRSRRGPFLGCSAYPKCRNTKPLPKPKTED